MMKPVTDSSRNELEVRPNLARIHWSYVNPESNAGRDASAEEARDKAWHVRDSVEEREWPYEDNDERFVCLVHCMML